eukprot:jgi/Orpsp1_1/1176205/evm.model.c7180000056767.1
MKKTVNYSFISYIIIIVITLFLFHVSLIEYLNFQTFNINDNDNILLYRDNI